MEKNTQNPVKIERQPREGKYYFISPRDLKVHVTQDWYFFSDNEKWDSHNYFLTKEAANACEEEIRDKWGEKLETLEYKKEQLAGHFIKEIIGIGDAYKKAKDEPDRDAAMFSVLANIQSFTDRRSDVYAAIKVIRDNITKLIKQSPKQ